MVMSELNADGNVDIRLNGRISGDVSDPVYVYLDESITQVNLNVEASNDRPVVLVYEGTGKLHMNMTGLSTFTGVIMLVCYVLDGMGHGNYTSVVLKRSPTLSAGRQALVSLLRWGRILAISVFVAWLSRYTGWLFLLAPPLIIACITFVSPSGPFRSRPATLYFVVVACASLGAGLAWCALQGWIPLFLASGLACMGSFLVFHKTALPCPPAAALSVLPSIVPEALIPWYPLHIAAGAAVFFALGALLFPASSKL